MPVYYDQDDAIKVFVKKNLIRIGFDSMSFASFLYMDSNGMNQNPDGIEYEKVINKVCQEFSHVDKSEIVSLICVAMEEEEHDWLEGWMQLLHKQ
ncbi:hypothetical protein CL614_09785 [archaeon]|nr:hypothetical protein [archaeon]|tara:strand:+ start:7332 stop:7616 length:285 start_codon:yes stop_codon:yes gene_type:complete